MNIEDKIYKEDYTYYTYIDCYCTSFDHLCRFNYDTKDKTFYLEFKLNPFELPRNEYTTPNIFLKRILFYFKNIWYAIKGRSNKYTSMAVWDIKNAKQIKEFIEYCTSLHKDKYV